MIFDKVNEIEKYACFLENWQEILTIYKESNNKEVGRYDWSNGFYMIQEGETKPFKECKFEAHKKFIDIQILLKGKECVKVAPINTLQVSDEYNEDKDIEFLIGEGSNLILRPEDMYILFPHDGHMPCCHVHQQTNYRKLVIKYKLD